MKRTEEALAADTTGSVLMGCEDARDAAKDGTSSLTNKAIFDAAVDGDKLALKIVDETAMYLAAGCLNFARIVDPAIIVFRCALSWRPLLSLDGTGWHADLVAGLVGAAAVRLEARAASCC